jgi:hypothetical protein
MGCQLFAQPIVPLAEQGAQEERTMTGTNGVCQVRDRRLCYEPQPSPDEVKRQQTATAEALRRGKAVAKFAAVEAGVEVGAHGAEHALAGSSSGLLRAGAKALQPVAIGVAAVKGTMLLQQIINMSKEEGRELNQAYAAQSRDVAILMIVAQTDPDSMPSGFLPHRAHAIGAQKFQHPAFKLASEVTSSTSPDAAELRAAVLQSFNRGRAAVYSTQISSQQALDEALKNNASLKKDFDADPAFRQGVLAAMDQATRDRGAFAANVQIVQTQQSVSLQRP